MSASASALAQISAGHVEFPHVQDKHTSLTNALGLGLLTRELQIASEQGIQDTLGCLRSMTLDISAYTVPPVSLSAAATGCIAVFHHPSNLPPSHAPIRGCTAHSH